MPPKRGRAKEGATPVPTAQPDIKQSILNSEKSSRRALRLDEDAISNAEDEDSVVETIEVESEDQATNQVSNNQLANMMANLSKKFAEMEDKLVTVNANAKIFNEKMSLWDTKVDKLSDTCSQLSNKVDEISSNALTLSESLTTTQADLEKVMTTQEEFEEKYQEILRLVESLKEKEEMLESQQREIEELKDLQVYQQREIDELQEFKEKSLDRDEIREQYGRKMNLWVYGLDQSSRGENTWEVVKKFSEDVLGLNRQDIDRWSIKNAHRVGDPTKPKRPVIIAFLRWEDRQTFLRKSATLFQHNKDHDTSYSIKTDLAPRARQLRKDYYVISGLMKAQEKCQARVRDNPKGAVWIQKKFEKDHDWANVTFIEEKYINQLKNIREKEAIERSKQGVLPTLSA